jgi:anti-anti-sigma regulatory factor
MIITISKTEESPSIVTLHLEGKLDGANYETLIEAAREIYSDGQRDLILDLSKLTFISSAGLSSIHQVALLFRGETLPNHDSGWAAYHAIERDLGKATQQHVKLLAPSKTVKEAFDLTGFATLFESYDDMADALASFAQPVLEIH